MIDVCTLLNGVGAAEFGDMHHHHFVISTLCILDAEAAGLVAEVCCDCSHHI